MRLFAAVILLAVLLVAGSAPLASRAASPTSFRHPASALPYAGSGRAQPTPAAVNYDEQIGMTFTQPFTDISYNVTAVQQTDSDGYGPGYLLNGVTDGGYWYQIGISYDWPGTAGYVPGWGVNYEVWDRAGNSVFPTDGGGGLANLTGPVNDGDKVLLGLRFSGGLVQMTVKDWNTGASGSEPYQAFGSTFIGLAAASDPNGYFSGPMTEWYHVNPYYATDRAVVYDNPKTALASADVWVDEFDSNSLTLVFGSDQPFTFTNPGQFLSFSTNGAEIHADAYTFITGTIAQTPLTFDYSVAGGGSGYSAPVLTYVYNGTTETATLTGAPVAYYADVGTNWSISATLLGSTSTERWATAQAGGTASSPLSESFVYYHQFLARFAYQVSGGTGYSAPPVRATAFGGQTSVKGNTSAWVDAGGAFSYPATLPGSSASERWAATDSAGTVSGSAQVTVRYFLEYGVTLSYSIVGGGTPGTPSVSGTRSGNEFSSQVTNSSTYFVDPGSTWSVTTLLPGSNGQERWLTAQTAGGTASAPEVLVLSYRHQFSLSFAADPAAGGSTGQSSGWADAGSTVRLTQVPSQGWKFEGWTGSGSGSYTGPSNSTALVIVAPITETAAYYPGLTIQAGANGAVAYAFGSTTGTVQAGSSQTVFAAPGTAVTLGADPSSFLYAFSGWGGGATGPNAFTTMILSSPSAVQAAFALNEAALMGIAGGAAVAAVALALAIRSWRRHKIKTLRSLPQP